MLIPVVTLIFFHFWANKSVPPTVCNIYGKWLKALHKNTRVKEIFISCMVLNLNDEVNKKMLLMLTFLLFFYFLVLMSWQKHF